MKTKDNSCLKFTHDVKIVAGTAENDTMWLRPVCCELLISVIINIRRTAKQEIFSPDCLSFTLQN